MNLNVKLLQKKVYGITIDFISRKVSVDIKIKRNCTEDIKPAEV